MPAALTVVGGFVIKPSVIVIKDEVLAFIAHDIGNTLKIFGVFGENKCARIICQTHSRRVNKAALVINASGILRRADSDVG